MFDAVMLEGVNDADDDAYRVASLLAGCRQKVVIPYGKWTRTP